MSRIFQWPVVGVGLFIIATSITVGLLDAIAPLNDGNNSDALLIFIPTAPYASAILE